MKLACFICLLFLSFPDSKSYKRSPSGSGLFVQSAGRIYFEEI
jgi:hypothetical protein